MQVAICAITYKRPEGLRRLLAGLAAQHFDGGPPHIRCIVVDNDEQGSARSACEDARHSLRWPVTYVIEPRRGIPQARNRALAEAGASDYVAFIDDDEVPDSDWLAQLIRTLRDHDADAAAGPVEPHFEVAPPAWVRRCGAFARHKAPTGTRLDRSATNNVLIRREIIEANGLRFDEQMVLTGGSDIHFFRRLHRCGGRIVWADKAIVTEWIPPTRATARWILQRAFRFGASTAWIQRDLRAAHRAVPYLLVLGLYKLLKGALVLPVWSLTRGKAGLVNAGRLLWAGAGIYYGLIGRRYHEYRTIHGR